MIQGPAAQHLQLHFAQRWSHSFTHDPCKTQNFTHSIPQKVSLLLSDFTVTNAAVLIDYYKSFLSKSYEEMYHAQNEAILFYTLLGLPSSLDSSLERRI